MVSIGETRKTERAKGPATVMAIGTANPPNCVDQSTYTLITTSESPTNEHKTELKEKFTLIWQPNFRRRVNDQEEVHALDGGDPEREPKRVSEYMAQEVPKLGKE